jgi:hypothetical protein
MANTMVTVTVSYAVEYDGKVTEDDIDVNDVIRDLDAITNIKVKTWTMSFYNKYLKGLPSWNRGVKS